MATIWRTFGRQALAYGGGSLAGALTMILIIRLLVTAAQGWPRLDLGRVSFAQLPGEIITATVANFVFLLLPFLLARAIVVMNAEAMSGGVGPLAAAVSGAVPALVIVLALAWLVGSLSSLNATSLLITLLEGAVLGLVYRRLGGFAGAIRP